MTAKPVFQVRVLGFSVLGEIEGTRTPQHFAAMLDAMLDAMDYGDTSGMSDQDLRDMCLMSLQDLDPDEAAYVVLKHDLDGVLRDGQLRDIAGGMTDDKMWEEYATPAFHERLFIVGCLLYDAVPNKFPKPDAVRIRLEVTAENPAAKALLTGTPKEPFLVRLLADGMDGDAILHRLYGEQISGPSFPNAEEVVWTVNTETAGDGRSNIEVTGSDYWLGPLRGTKSYESNAYADPD